ncbi:hypothetical protein GJV07_23345 [Enterobacteriaceae bacterium RIT711]|nr:hypothetical protein [Enterobacteriaceae bacterium RIT711]
MNEKKKFPHIIHGIMTFFTSGVWAIVWIIRYNLRDPSTRENEIKIFKLRMQFFAYMAFGLILLLITLGHFSTFSEPGMTLVPIVLSGIVCFLWLVTAAISLFWSITAIPSMRENYPKLVQKTPKFFNNYLIPVMLFLILIIAGQINDYSIEHQGSNLHFTDGFKEAKSNNIFSVEEWNSFNIQKEKEREIANAEKERIEKEKKAKNYIESKINALDSKDPKRFVAENIYKQHGVWIDDYFALQKQECASEFKKLLNVNDDVGQEVDYFNQTSDAFNRSGVRPDVGGRSLSNDPSYQSAISRRTFARDQLEQCGVRHIDQIENRVTVQ